MDFHNVDANEAVADIAYRLSEIIAIYPITPASPMGEHADSWASDNRKNLWGQVPEVIEMQSESGAIACVHGALQAGTLATTFTASQGLLLMLPSLFKIAGQLFPLCLHVAARAVANQALSIFGDHSDVMAVRSSGVAMLASTNPQEAHDFALIGHALALESSIPVLHFFDGFRTSHEIRKIAYLDDEILKKMISEEAIKKFRNRALNPEKPVLRGSAQNPDVYFQAREACEIYYQNLPKILKEILEKFAKLTKRTYKLFEYIGDPEAERIVVLMGSACDAVEETVDFLVTKQKEKVGVLKVRLFRPFSPLDFINEIPKTVKQITILDRTKEPGSAAEPLFAEISSALLMLYSEGKINFLPQMYSGRYGLGSKEFNPPMIKAIFDNMVRLEKKSRFTVGIKDDICHTSLDYDKNFTLPKDDIWCGLFFGLGSDGTVSANKISLKIIGEKTPLFTQGYFEYDSKKSGSITISHLRIAKNPIKATYKITRADFIAVHDEKFFFNRDVLSFAEEKATLLVNSIHPPEYFLQSLPITVQKTILEKKLKVYVVPAAKVAQSAGLGRRINTVMQVCFFRLTEFLPLSLAIQEIKEHILQTYGKRGQEVVRRNFLALETALQELKEVPVPTKIIETSHTLQNPVQGTGFVEKVTLPLLKGMGDELPVSYFPADGSWPTGTSQYEKRQLATQIPIWQSDLCVECNYCVMICPHSTIRSKLVKAEDLQNAPAGFPYKKVSFSEELKDYYFVLAVAPEDCTGCGLCIEICPARDKKMPKRKALVAMDFHNTVSQEKQNWEFFLKLSPIDVRNLKPDRRTTGFRQPLFEFSGACSGCGETPYIRLLTQLFGDHLVIANATGCSSIYGGNLPTTPYTKNQEGQGPAWANSLFEDNAEFGFGISLGFTKREEKALLELSKLRELIPQELWQKLQEKGSGDLWAFQKRKSLWSLAHLLPEKEKEWLWELLPKTVWIIGGDGWAYDIGYGGLDHVLALGKKINILVLDTEVYSNTGGQASKATPLGAAAKFASAGKSTRKKDLGLLAMSYGHVYVAQIALQANSKHAVETLLEAASYPGPSLVLAHSPCIAHGYDLVFSPTQQKRAIACGMWPLYRFNPLRIEQGESPLILDSPEPTIDVSQYMENEARFTMVHLRSPEHYEKLVEMARLSVKQRYAYYEQLSHIHLPTQTTKDTQK